MKKFYILALLVLTSVCAFAARTYVHIYVTGMKYTANNLYLSGQLPPGINTYYNDITIGEMLNKLSKYGFELESIAGAAGSSGDVNGLYVLSKNSEPDSDSAPDVIVDNTADVYEVARYNLQGMPVNENTPGVQIVVYSNYTTRTVIVQ